MKHLFAAAASLILCAGSSHALTFSGVLDGVWVGSIGFDDASGEIDDGGNTARWGNPDEGDTKSRMRILDGGFSHELVGGHNLYALGSVKWKNESWTDFDDSFTLWADWTIDINSPVDLVQTEVDFIDFNIVTSSNSLADSDDQALILSFSPFNLALPVDLGGGYLLEAIVLTQSGAGSLTGLDWRNPEDGKSYITINAQISGPTPVPLPAAGWMLLAGVGGLVAAKRRAKKKAV